MSRLVALAVVLAAGPAHAQPVTEPVPDVGEAPGPDVAERELGASLGTAIGIGGTTPGGVRVGGHYLYQLSDLDWFDGELAFAFGSGTPACFRDRDDDVVCDHGVADGFATDVRAGVRRFFGGRPGFRPWIGPGLGVRLAYFAKDQITGAGLFASARGGIRARVNDEIAVGGEAGIDVGGALFHGGLGAAVELDVTVAATVDFALP